MTRRHFFPWCMFSYRLSNRTMWGPPETRQCISTSRLALGVSYRICSTHTSQKHIEENIFTSTFMFADQPTRQIWFFFFKTLFKSVICSSLQSEQVSCTTQCGPDAIPDMQNLAQVLVDFEEKGSDVNGFFMHKPQWQCVTPFSRFIIPVWVWFTTRFNYLF